MSEAIKAAISELQNQIGTWEREIAETKRVCNTLAARAGIPAIYGDADLQSKTSVLSLRRDQFYGKTLGTAMREYLAMRKASNLGPATVHDLFAALVEGGFDHGSANDDNAKRVMRITLTKNSSIFHRLPDDKHFGLTEWYPAAKTRKPKDEHDDPTPDEQPLPHPQTAHSKPESEATA